MELDASLLNTQYHKVRIKDKWSNLEKGVAPFPTPHYSSYWKGSLWVAIDYGRSFFLILYISKFMIILDKYIMLYYYTE